MKPLIHLLIGLVTFLKPSAQTCNKDSVLEVAKQIRARPVDTVLNCARVVEQYDEACFGAARRGAIEPVFRRDIDHGGGRWEGI
ncbi:MAG: hypothetical protein ACK5OP_07795 [Sphingobacteriales bacterium]